MRQLVALFCLVVVMTGSSAFAASVRANVIFNDGTSPAERDRAVLGAGAAKVQNIAVANAVTVVVPNAASWNALKSDASVKLVEEDFVYEAINVTEAASRGKPGSGTPPPPSEFPNGVKRIGADDGVGGAGTTVAVIDTGIDLTHSDLAGNITGEKSFVSNIVTGNDDNGHGSHVAGTVAAVKNGSGVAGVAPDAKLLAVKVLNRRGSGFSSDIANGINWVTNAGGAPRARVINMSLGSSSSSSVIEAACNNAALAGVVLVCAAGNSGPSANTVGYPAAYDVSIAVSAWYDKDGTSADSDGASNPDETLASFSSWGPQVDIAAPGVSIYSTYKSGGYSTLNGTSMASPHVAGVVARIISSNPGADAAAVRTLLTTKYIEKLTGWSAEKVGSGLVHATPITTP